MTPPDPVMTWEPEPDRVGGVETAPVPVQSSPISATRSQAFLLLLASVTVEVPSEPAASSETAPA
jgi:hypothetical protein